MKKRYWFLLLYLLLLASSHLWRRLAPPPAVVAAIKRVTLESDEGKVGAEKEVHIAYRQWPAEEPLAETRKPVVLMLHGSPGSSRDFAQLALLLQEDFWLLAPDLPGFGASQRNIPDYSIRAHALYLLRLMDQLGIAKAQVIGFSMGGGVALELSALAPHRVSSLSLVSSIGVQDLELLGNYRVNHALHGLQWAGLWGLFELVPHFGAFDRSMLDLGYGRNFLDTDQRPLREILRRFTAPMLILHGEGDVLVPAAAAREHHRLVPQSELAMFDASHFMLFRDPERLREPLADFLHRVAAGQATTRAGAAPARVEQAGEPFRATIAKAQGMAALVWMFLLASATMASEDLACIVGGLMVANGRLGYLPAAAACTIGIFLGDLLLYTVGRFLGRPWLHRAPLKWWVSPTSLERSARWFDTKGGRMIFATRFIPGTRLPTYVSAGILRMNPWTFTSYLFLPVAIWAPLLVAASYLLGDRILNIFAVFSHYALPLLAATVLLVWLLLKLVGSLSSHRSRRLLLGWWKRHRQWEFWSPWFFYPPVLLYVLWLGLKHRSPSLFTAANPGIENGGGFIGESKTAILRGLDSPWVARFELIRGGESPAAKTRQALAFQQRADLGFPLVLKPDIGQRGAKVMIARTAEDVALFFAEETDDAIVQEYIGGPELGIFYVRLPGDEKGRIFSITDKRLPVVVGNGQSTLEDLILDDSRAIAMAHTYFHSMESRLQEVPAQGESVRLVELGTHCRGAVFLDGKKLWSIELEAAIEDLARSLDGFYFGRFDLRGESLAAFRQGRGFKVLELNGVTSEATHIYDPGMSLWQAYGVLRQQWSLAFEIAARNRRAGAKILSIGEVLGLLLRHR